MLSSAKKLKGRKIYIDEDFFFGSCATEEKKTAAQVKSSQ